MLDVPDAKPRAWFEAMETTSGAWAVVRLLQQPGRAPLSSVRFGPPDYQLNELSAKRLAKRLNRVSE